MCKAGLSTPAGSETDLLMSAFHLRMLCTPVLMCTFLTFGHVQFCLQPLC
jgi:hypothetical protein